VKNGKVLLDDPKALPEGTEVEVRPVQQPRQAAQSKKRPQSLAERLSPFIGKVKDLPPELSINLDHYLHGLPKRS
jgi:hypothetical protein